MLLLCSPLSARAAPDFVFATPAAVEGMARRDEAMKFNKNKGNATASNDAAAEEDAADAREAAAAQK